MNAVTSPTTKDTLASSDAVCVSDVRKRVSYAELNFWWIERVIPDSTVLFIVKESGG